MATATAVPRAHDNVRSQSPSRPSYPSSYSSINDAKPATPSDAEQTNADQVVTSPPKRPGFSSRLSRMFTAKDVKSPPSAPKDKEQTSASPTDSGSEQSSRRPSAVTRPSTKDSNMLQVPDGPSDTRPRMASNSSERRPRGSSVGSEKKPDGQNACSRRFTMLDDGTHEHFLKSDKRQEKLSNMFRNMLGMKKEGKEDDQQLSLVSNWVDQVKSEKVASDQKGGPNCAQSLVEKYGKCQEVVGRGAFGIVRISHKTDQDDPRKEQLYAVKEFRRRPSESDKKYNKRLTSEFCISSALRHPNVIHTLDLLKDAKGDFCEVMEYCSGGDLYTLVLAAGKLEVIEADCYFKQLMRGVEYMHEMGVAHRDLKPENLLLTTHGALKITDFGNGECFRMAWEKEAHMVAGLCGSAPYISPEEYIDSEFDPRAVDVWACGVIYMAMRTGRHLWRVAKKEEDEFYTRYLEGRKDEDGYGPIETLHRARCRNVIYSILDPNPSRRITASQVLRSEWGREIKLCKAGEEGF